MMNIHFFGNSILRRRKDENGIKTFVDILVEKYKSECTTSEMDYHRGLAQCSEERILYYLKKTNIESNDLVIIFHAANPLSVFVPCLDKDFVKSQFPYEDKQYWIDTNKSLTLVSPITQRLPKTHDETFDATLFKEKEVFLQEITEIMEFNFKYFYNQDIQLNRYYGAMIQIDQYLTSKNIKVIHCIKNTLPSWFKFNSGIVDDTLAHFQYKKHGCSYAEVSNAITRKGNKIVAKKLIEYIEKLNKLNKYCALLGSALKGR